MGAGSRNKILFLSSIVLVLVIVVIIFFPMLTSDFTIMQKQTIQPYELVEESQVKIRLDDDIKLYYISDSIDNIYYYLMDGEEVISLNMICNIKEIESSEKSKEIYWTGFEQPGAHTIFTGVIANDDIQKIIVENMNDDEFSYFVYRGYTIFYYYDRNGTALPPLLINGYSKSNELIFKNYQTDQQNTPNHFPTIHR